MNDNYDNARADKAILAKLTAPEVPKGHACKRCAQPIDPRFEAFLLCTVCAVVVNEEALIPWRAAENAKLAALRAEKKVLAEELRLRDLDARVAARLESPT